MEENDVKSTCSGIKLDFKTEKYEKFLISKSDKLESSLLKIWQDEEKIFQNLTRCIFFNSKSDALYFF